jgi:ATP synthase subunit 6
MSRLLSYVFSTRGLVALVIVFAAIFLANKYTAHHSSEGLSPFPVLYGHVLPSPLTTGEGSEARALFEMDANWAPAAFDTNPSAEGTQIALFNLQLFQIASVLLCLWCFLGVPKYLRSGKGDPVTKLLAGFAMWIRDEIVYPEMGKDRGRKFLPYFLSIFFFILFMNLMGLVPMSYTATTSIFVTAGLALTTLIAMIGCGMAVQGPLAFWKNLVPHVPLALWPLMFLVELIGLIVKPFALMIRLFANLTGGHMVVLSFMGLIFMATDLWGPAGGYGAAPLGVGFAVFIMIIEAFVALLQAFIFTQLSVMFISASVHPEH